MPVLTAIFITMDIIALARAPDSMDRPTRLLTPSDAFHKAGVRMARAEGILRAILETQGVNEKLMERVTKFFDPEPL